MSIALLLLREEASTSLTTTVQKSQSRKPPFLLYELHLNQSHLDLVVKPGQENCPKSSISDEGFESDIDSLSLISSDDSFGAAHIRESSGAVTELETDSANGSAGSDSDDTEPSKNAHSTIEQNALDNKCPSQLKESFNLVQCLCYNDVKFNDILVFVIRNEALVFKFDDLLSMQKFYAQFTKFKALCSQIVYNKNVGSTFNLLQRTDNNGITHIQISRPNSETLTFLDDGPSSIISLNTPEDNLNALIKAVSSERKSSYRKESKDANVRNTSEGKTGFKIDKSSSASDLLDIFEYKAELNNLQKVWNSTENLLDSPARPERKKRVKGKAPLPPAEDTNRNILSGQYVRVNVHSEIQEKFPKPGLIVKSHHAKEQYYKKPLNLNIPTNKTGLLNRAKPPQILRYQQSNENLALKPKIPDECTWMNSMPRQIKKRSKSETRNYPMAYRYIDATTTYPTSSYPAQDGTGTFSRTSKYTANFHAKPQMLSTYSSNINNRLFGLSDKLKEFKMTNDDKEDERWKCDGNLKSVIKKDENKKKNEKKVTFSAYTTVQVL